MSAIEKSKGEQRRGLKMGDYKLNRWHGSQDLEEERGLAVRLSGREHTQHRVSQGSGPA